MSFLDEVVKGFRFAICGILGDTLRMKNDDGTVTRFLRIRAFGKTYNLGVDSDEELERYKPLEGKQVRASGLLSRKSGRTTVQTRITDIKVEGEPGFVAITAEEMMAGCKYIGAGVVQRKTNNIIEGKTYYKWQVNGFGDTFEFSDIDPGMHADLPSSGPVMVSGHLEPVVMGNASGTSKDVQLVLVIDDYKVGDGPARQPARSTAKPDEQKPA